MKMEQTNSRRRNFLRTFGLGAVAALAAVLTGRREMITPKGDATAAAPAAAKGYHLSEHVKRYYHTTRV